jgi:SAM-dependent methyltransferase
VDDGRAAVKEPPVTVRAFKTFRLGPIHITVSRSGVSTTVVAPLSLIEQRGAVTGAIESGDGGGVEERYFASEAEQESERARLQGLESEFDPTTTRHMDRLGVAKGWRCLEVAAGLGSIARWLSARVGSSGRVVATDLETRYLIGLPANVEARRHDILTDEVEAHAYDLVHCRNLLVHLPDPTPAVEAMAAALRPRGWLLLEEGDLDVARAAARHPGAELFDSLFGRQVDFLDQAATIRRIVGSSLSGLLGRLGLVDVGNEGVTRVVRGGEPYPILWQQTARLVGPRLVEHHVASEQEVAEYQRLFADPTFAFRSTLFVSTWARHPSRRRINTP